MTNYNAETYEPRDRLVFNSADVAEGTKGDEILGKIQNNFTTMYNTVCLWYPCERDGVTVVRCPTEGLAIAFKKIASKMGIEPLLLTHSEHISRFETREQRLRNQGLTKMFLTFNPSERFAEIEPSNK